MPNTKRIDVEKLARASKDVRGAVGASLCAEVLLAVENLEAFIHAPEHFQEHWGMVLNASKLFSSKQERRLLRILNTED